MRFAGGVGYVDLSLEFDALPGATVDSRGGGLAWQFDFGGALADGVVMGAGYHGVVATDPEVEGASTTSSTSASFLMLGGFISVFPDPRGGLELGGMLALALAEQSAADPLGDTAILETDLLGGPGVAVWVGYAGWVSANWAIGGLVRGSAGWMSGTSQSFQPGGGIQENDTSATARSIALCFNAVYQ
jgi:hypothetical protein